jgi:hypothetical protein
LPRGGRRWPPGTRAPSRCWLSPTWHAGGGQRLPPAHSGPPPAEPSFARCLPTDSPAVGLRSPPTACEPQRVLLPPKRPSTLGNHPECAATVGHGQPRRFWSSWRLAAGQQDMESSGYGVGDGSPNGDLPCCAEYRGLAWQHWALQVAVNGHQDAKIEFSSERACRKVAEVSKETGLEGEFSPRYKAGSWAARIETQDLAVAICSVEAIAGIMEFVPPDVLELDGRVFFEAREDFELRWNGGRQYVSVKDRQVDATRLKQAITSLKQFTREVGRNAPFRQLLFSPGQNRSVLTEVRLSWPR